MGNVPTEEELKIQLLKSIDEATFAKDLATLQAQNAIYKMKPMLAIPMIAKLHNVKLDFGLKFKANEVDPSEIMPEGQWMSLNQLKNTPYKLVNVRGWIVSIGKLGKTAKGDKAKITFALADAAGVMDPIWIFGDEAENFSKMIDYSLGKAINIMRLAIKDSKDITKNFMRCEKKTQLSVCREPPCALGAVNTGALANIGDGYSIIKAMIMSDMEDIEKHGCPKYHYLDGEVGTTMPCSYCGGVPQTIVAYNAGRCLIADETAQLTMEISGDIYNNNRPQFITGDAYLIRGKYSNNVFYYYESYHIGKFEAATISSATVSSVTVRSTGGQNHADTPIGKMWYAIRTKNYKYESKDDSLLLDMEDAGIINDPKNDHHYITMWDSWTDVEDLLKESKPTFVHSLPTVEQFLGTEDTERADDPHPDIIQGFVKRYQKMLSKVYPSLSKALLYEAMSKNNEANFKAKPFVEALLAANMAELVWQNNEIIMVAK